MEVLAPSMVPQVPKWVPILDKAVVSKVFTDVGMMPLSREGRISSGGGGSGGERGSAESLGVGKKLGRVPPRVCNPHAVKLETYEKKLEKLSSKITDRIVSVARSALKDAGDEADDDLASILPSFSKEKEKANLINLLGKFKLEEIAAEVTLLENEFSRAKKYQRRSEDIRQMSTEMVKDARKSKNKTKEQGNDPKSAGKKRKKGKKSDDREDASLFTATVESDLLSPSDPPLPNVGNLKGQRPRSADLPRGVTFKDPPVEGPSVGAKDSPIEEALIGAKDSPVTSPASGAGSSSRPRNSSQQRPTTSHHRSSSSSAPPVRVSTAATRRAFGTLDDLTRPKLQPNSLKGQRVIARDAHSGFYYPGVVLSCPKPGEVHVQFDSTAMSVNNQLILVKHVIPTSGAIGRPSLRVDDAALTRVLLGETKDEIWIPCHVTHLPHHGEDQTLQFHSVEIYSGKTLTSPRRHLVKIAENSFVQMVQFIHDVQRRDEWMRHMEEQKRLAGFREKLLAMGVGGEDGGAGDAVGGDEAAGEEREKVIIPWGGKAKRFDSNEEGEDYDDDDEKSDAENYHDEEFDDESDGGDAEKGGNGNADVSGGESEGDSDEEDRDVKKHSDYPSKNDKSESADSSENESEEEREADLSKGSSAGYDGGNQPTTNGDGEDEVSNDGGSLNDDGDRKGKEEEEEEEEEKAANDETMEQKEGKNSKRNRKHSKSKSAKSSKTSKTDAVVKSSEADKAKDEVVHTILKELPFDTQKILLEEHQRRLQDLNDRLRLQVVDGEVEKQKNRQKQKRMLKKIKKEMEAKGEEVKEIMRKEREIEEAQRRAEMERRRDEDIVDLR